MSVSVSVKSGERWRENAPPSKKNATRELERQRVEQHASESAERLAGDLRHDIDKAAPGYIAGLIIAAVEKPSHTGSALVTLM